ncbi:MAG: cytochrome-c peroxidase, partial [Thermodesulfovibrionales bacterium]|nr:cytochrome-c peroxidase [Thermodesulfovibrionales bacterium]
MFLYFWIPGQARNDSKKNICILLGTFLVTLFLYASFSYAGHLEPFKSAPVPKQNPQTPEKIELGKKLFFDRRLSGDSTMSCATCHMPELAF